MNTSKSLDDILDDLYVSTHGGHIPVAIAGSDSEADVLDFKAAKVAIVEAVEGLVPTELRDPRNKLFTEAYKNGWNNHRHSVLQAIKEWQ